jgi:AcrR family transcriptional regulator
LILFNSLDVNNIKSYNEPMTPRAYSSSIREAQVEHTRALLLETARNMLVEGGLEALTLPKLAQAASVSVPTVYRYFPTLDDLFRAFLDWLRPQLGLSPERLLSAQPEQLPLENFPRYEAESAVLRPLMESREFNRVRVASIRDRARTASARIRPRAPGWSDAQLEALSGAVFVFASPQMWRWLRDTWGLENEEAARAASWAAQALLGALARGPATAKPKTKAQRSASAKREQTRSQPTNPVRRKP